MSFERLIAPSNHGYKRSKKDIARALLDITFEDKLWMFANLLAAHEVTDNYNVVRVLAHHLAEIGELHNIRLFSRRVAHRFASAGALSRIFERLQISPMYSNPDARRSKPAFTNVAYGCKELVVTVRECSGNHKYLPITIFKEEKAAGNDWVHVFKQCPNLTTITVVTEGCATGTVWNRTSSALTALRVAYEEAGLTKVDTLRLAPADMIYIGQFRWDGPAFGPTSPLAANAWSHITKLELHVLPPINLRELEEIQTVKIFNAWLRSFAPRLRSLKLCYVGRKGQHPFALLNDLDMMTRGQPNMRMPVLQELWLGQVKDAEDGTELLEELAPRLESYHVLIRAPPSITLLTFSNNSPQELWRCIQMRGPEPTREWSGLPIDYPTYQSGEAGHTSRPSESTVRSHPSHSSIPQSPALTTASKLPSSPFRSFFGSNKSAAASPPPPTHGKEPRQVSLPALPKPPRKRTSSVVSSIFSLRPRPKSDPSRLAIKLIGETPRDQVPPEFLGRDTNYVTLEESIARYGNDALNDLSRPPQLKLAERQRIGQLNYQPGTLFKAGSGARLPDAAGMRRGSGGSVESSDGQQPTPDQIRKAFETIGLGVSRSGYGDGDDGGERRVHSPEYSSLRQYSRQVSADEEASCYGKEERRRADYVAVERRGDVRQHSGNSSWETVDQGGGPWGSSPLTRSDWGGRSPVDERSRRHSRRISQLEDVTEEEDGDGHRTRGAAHGKTE